MYSCVYMLELTAGSEEAIRILRIAERVLVTGGLAFAIDEFCSRSRLRTCTVASQPVLKIGWIYVVPTTR
jgi:hypothetical protein